MTIDFGSFKKTAADFFDGFNKHDDMTLAASLAFYTALSLGPLILLVISAVGVLGGDSQARLIQQMTSIVGPQAGEGLKLIVQNANAHQDLSGLAGVIGILTLIFSASAVFAQLQSSLNVIWDSQNLATGAGWWVYLRRRFFSMGMVLALAFLSIVSLLISTVLSYVFTSEGFIWEVVNTVGSLVTFTFLFALIFKYVPDGRIGWRHVLFGGFLTALLFTIGRSAIGYYLGTSAPGSAYGAAGSFIVLLIWVYYSAIIVFVGAELTRAIFKEEKRTISDHSSKLANATPLALVFVGLIMGTTASTNARAALTENQSTSNTLPGHVAAQESAKEPIREPVKPVPPSKAVAPNNSAASTTSKTSTPIEGADTSKVVNLSAVRASGETQRLLKNLADESGWFPNVKIVVREGIVVISGTAKNADQIEWFAKTADRLPGVIAVINQTQVEQAPVTDLTPVWQELRSILTSVKRALPLLLIGAAMLVVFFFAGKYLSRMIRAFWGGHVSNPFLLTTVSRLTMIPVWTIFFYLALRTAGLSGLATTIIGGTGAASIVIGFAFKGIAENYLSGLLLAMRSPFAKGDEVQIDKFSGFVQSLNMRGTTIIDYDGNVVLIPNAIVIQSVVKNRTSNKSVRLSFTIGISYSDSIEKAFELITNILKTNKQVLQKPAARASVDKLSPSGVDLIVYFWFDAGVSNGDDLKALLVSEIKDQLLANGFHIPDSAREVFFPDTLNIKSSDFNETESESESGHAARAEKRLAENRERPPTDLQNQSKSGQATADDIASTGDGVKVMHKSSESKLLD